MKYKEFQVPDFDKININELNDSQFSILLRHAQTQKFSPFASFSLLLKGFNLYYKKEKITKWEAFYITKNAERILMNHSKVKAVKR